ncbi:putative Period protein 2/3C-terminal region-containing protein [Homarus americanus]|uniref:Period circadian protein n=1 Tax=Homarus americanus TaxID=6706 RepID=A0A8J5K392_HOMAM|nr:putative Period protein 2/3C-terminal region-containing protein [Homarus americanus]
MSAIPGVMYQTVAPPLFNAPPLITATSNVPPLTCAHQTPRLRQLKQNQDRREAAPLASGKIISSHSHIDESIRSYDSEMNRDSSQVSQFSQSTSVRAEAESIGSPGKQDRLAADDREQHHENSSDMVLSGTSSPSSLREYKSTDDSMQNISENSENSEATTSGMKWNTPRSKCQRPVLNDPPWLEDVKVTPELLYKYQMETKELVDVLRQDMDMLKRLRQPAWVDDQLSSLYNELELEGSSTDLHLEEGITSSSGEDQARTSFQTSPRKKKSSTYFSKMAMLHEEDAPMPPSDLWTERQHQAHDTSSSSS